MGKGSQGKPPFCQALSPQILWPWRYNRFSLSGDLSRPREQRVEQHYGGKPIMVSHKPAKFGGYMHCGSEDIVILVCHVMLQDHVIKWSCDLIGRNPFK